MSLLAAQEAKQKALKLIIDTSTFFGLFGTPPNYLLAVEEFQKAGNLYRSLNHSEEAIVCFCHAAECHKQLNSTYLAAKALETAAALAQKAQSEKLVDLYMEASTLYLLGNAPDRACEMLEKAAIGAKEPGKSIELFWECIRLYESEDRIKLSLDAFRRFIAFCIKSDNVGEAIQVSQKFADVYRLLGNKDLYCRQILTSVILCMSIGRGDRAQELYQSACTHLGMESSPEAELCLSLFNANDVDSLNSALGNLIIRYLDVEVVRLTKQLKPIKITMNSIQDEIEEEGYL
jgi:tetratricopeptide (TPR) repeat protein